MATGQVIVGGRFFNPDQTFTYHTGFGHAMTVNAAQAARIASGMSRTHDGIGWQNYESLLDPNEILPIQQQAAPAPAAASAPKRKAAPKPSITAPPQAPLPAVSDPIKKEEIEEITRPAEGLESTIKTAPRLLRERRRRTYLTAG